jgi:hypothetical protein
MTASVPFPAVDVTFSPAWWYANYGLGFEEEVWRDPMRPSAGIGNCPVCMISPETYRQVVLPADLWWRGHFVEFSLHHCGVFHPYAEVYQALQPAGLDVGWGTDLKVARRAYPRVPMSLELQDSAVVGKSAAELDALLAQMVENADPRGLVTRIWLAEACPDTPDSTVRALMTAPSRL